jgi:hypothetical protein
VVHDPLFVESLVGREVIARRFAAEVASLPVRSLRAINRKVIGDLLVAKGASGTPVPTRASASAARAPPTHYVA